jgi:hypothetical protein
VPVAVSEYLHQNLGGESIVGVEVGVGSVGG